MVCAYEEFACKLAGILLNKIPEQFCDCVRAIRRTLTHALILYAQKPPSKIVDPIFFALTNRKVKAAWTVISVSVSVSSNRLKFSEFFYLEALAALVQISTLLYIRVGIMFPIAIAMLLVETEQVLFCMDYKYYCYEKIKHKFKRMKRNE